MLGGIEGYQKNDFIAVLQLLFNTPPPQMIKDLCETNEMNATFCMYVSTSFSKA